MTNKIKLSLVASLLVTSAYAVENKDLAMITVSSATKSEQSIKDVTSNIDVITGAELEEKHLTSITEALNLVSGLSFTSNGGLGKSSSVRLRGFDSQRILVLLDGQRYNDFTSTAGAPFEDIMLSDVDRIEVIKGAQSGIWGADASAGVINIITKKPENGLHGSILGEVGSFDTKKQGFALSHATDKYYAKAAYNKVETDGFTAYAKKGENIDKYEDDGYKNETSSFKFGYNLNDNNNLELSHRKVNSQNEFDNASSDSLTNKSSSKTKLRGVRYNNTTDNVKSSLYYNNTEFFRDYPPYSSKYEGNVYEFGAKSDIEYLNKTSFLIVGFDKKKFKQKDVVNKDYTNKALYATNSNKFNNTVITESLRYDKYNKFENKNTGKLGIKHYYKKDIAVNSNIGTAYNIPKLGEMYGAFGANPNLKPETTKSFDLGFEYKGLKGTYFYNKIDDMIAWDSGAYNNIEGTSKINGFELDYKKDIINDTLLTLSYTRLLEAKDKDNKDLRRRAKETLKFGLDYYGINKLHLGLNGEYVGSRYDDTAKTQRTGYYTVANFVANYDLTKNVKVYTKVDNIADKTYQTANNYATSPRAYYAGVKVSF